jgi:glucose/arabinose dehydrogenase
MKPKLFALIASLLSVLFACSNPPVGQGNGELEKSSQTNTSFKVEKVIGGLEVPWSIVWTPDGRMIFTERPGRVRVFEKGNLTSKPLLCLTSIPRVKAD